jgi:hypothetical protein
MDYSITLNERKTKFLICLVASNFPESGRRQEFDHPMITTTTVNFP